MTTKEPYRIVSDNDGHYYVMPESCAARFEELINMGDQGVEQLSRYSQYSIDRPEDLKLYKWELS